MEKIDFVITWVDGSDPDWQAEKAKYEKVRLQDDQPIRYRDWDTLRYWFRGVEAYAPWVNRIHFITWGHVPAWLNTAHPKLNIVCHDSYIPTEYLPTFSSHPIELNMHRIPGLSERFVYFNDDFFLTAPVKPQDFFRNGLPCDSLEEMPLDLSWRNLMVRINANDILFLNAHFSKSVCRKQSSGKWFSWRTPAVAGKNALLSLFSRQYFYGLNIHHLPQAYLKTTMEEVWQADREWLHETCCHKFRHGEDVSPHIFKFWQLAKGDFFPYNKRKYGKWYAGGSDWREPCHVIRSRSKRFICYNDSPKVDFEAAKQALCAAFQEALPERCGFEVDHG